MIDYLVPTTYNAVIISDPRDNGYTGFILELPEVIAGGFDKNEVMERLSENLKFVIDYRRKEDLINANKIQGYTTETYKIEVAV